MRTWQRMRQVRTSHCGSKASKSSDDSASSRAKYGVPQVSDPIEAECHPEPAKDPQLVRRTRDADPSSPALREASLRAEPTGLPCAKRACERSPWACPARSEPASGAHGFLLRMTFTQEHPGRRDVRKSSGPARLNSGDPGPDDPDVARA